MTCAVDIAFTLNGREVRLTVSPEMSALEMLRGRLDLTGTKYVCGEGECGACTIIMDGESLNSCLLYAVDCDGRDLRTIEGLSGRQLSGLQESFVRNGAIQCGYCMPGMIMQATWLIESGRVKDLASLRRGLEGNLCRCTGYHAVFDAVSEMVGLGRP